MHSLFNHFLRLNNRHTISSWSHPLKWGTNLEIITICFNFWYHMEEAIILDESLGCLINWPWHSSRSHILYATRSTKLNGFATTAPRTAWRKFVTNWCTVQDGVLWWWLPVSNDKGYPHGENNCHKLDGKMVNIMCRPIRLPKVHTTKTVIQDVVAINQR